MVETINKALYLIRNGQPAYYISTSEMTEENGRKLALTWADYIRIDFEHGPLDLPGLKKFMLGLRAKADQTEKQMPAVLLTGAEAQPPSR